MQLGADDSEQARQVLRETGFMHEQPDGRWIASTDTQDEATGVVTPAGELYEWPQMERQIHTTGSHASYPRAYCPACAEARARAASQGDQEPAARPWTECDYDPDHIYSQCATPEWHLGR